MIWTITEDEIFETQPSEVVEPKQVVETRQIWQLAETNNEKEVEYTYRKSGNTRYFTGC